jgi:hypothetical protein
MILLFFPEAMFGQTLVLQALLPIEKYMLFKQTKKS